MKVAELERSGLLRRGVPLAPLSTYRFGGDADWYAEPGSETDVAAVIEAADELGVELIVLGRGSNVVISDAGLRAMVIRLAGDFAVIDPDSPDGPEGPVDPGGVVGAGAAVPLPLLARHTVARGRGGLEFFVGIPGSVGGAVRMNAGCFGVETADRMIDARIMDRTTARVRRATPEDLEMRYRSTAVGRDDIVLSARFATTTQDTDTGKAKLREITRWRRDHQPGGTLNAGSVFKNPPGDSAGRLIDHLGLKGFRVGGAAVSPRHANFFEAAEGATAQDVRDLVEAVRRRVTTETGIVLEPEVAFLGEFSEPAAQDSPQGGLADRTGGSS